VRRNLVLALALLVVLGGLWIGSRARRCFVPPPGRASRDEETAAPHEGIAAPEAPVPLSPPPALPAAPALPRAPRHDPAPRAAAVSPEAAWLEEMRAKLTTDPVRVEALARQARSRFGDSALADERDALLVDALINQQRIGSARSETYYYYDHHKDGAFAAHLFARTGVHPTPPTPGPH